MKRRKLWFKPYGLRFRFMMSILISLLAGIVVFCGLYYNVDTILNHFFADSAFGRRHVRMQVESLQDYITENEIDSRHLAALEIWAKKEPLILLEMYDQEQNCIYSSIYKDTEGYVDYVIGDDFITGRNNAFSIDLADKTVTAVIYSDFSYQYYVLLSAAAFFLALLVFVIVFVRNTSNMIRYICKLENDVMILEGGNLEYQVTEQGNDELTDLARSLNRMRSSFLEQLQTEQNLHQVHKTLITEMSHDLRTPLTGIILYTEILRTHKYSSEEEMQTYLEKIDNKAHLMKQLSDHLFEYSVDGHSPKLKELAEMEPVLQVELQNAVMELEARGFQVDTDLEWKQSYIQVKREYLDRIFENVVSNIAKYAKKEVPIQISTAYARNHSGLVFTNTIAEDPNLTESSAIGIKSIQTMMKEMGGICSVEETDTVFEISLLFENQ